MSWNVAGRVKKLPDQLAAIQENHPDILALQEITKTTLPKWLHALKTLGYHVSHSFDFVIDQALLIGGRKYGVITATTWEQTILPIKPIKIPWHERFLPIRTKSSFGPIEVHNIHMPAGVSHGVIKAQTFEGLYTYLAKTNQTARILCGDFNSPRHEYPNGEIITFGKGTRRKKGRLVNDTHNRQASAEKSVMKGLEKFNLIDVFRSANGYEKQAYSWVHKWRTTRTYRRFDHIFASKEFEVADCQYINNLREEGLSDHAPIMAILKT